MDAQGAPAVLAGAGVDAVRAGQPVAVAIAAGDETCGKELEQCRRDELDAGLQLRDVHVAATPGALPQLQGGKHGNQAVAHGDVVDVRPPEDGGFAVRPAGQVDEPALGAQVGPEAGSVCPGPGLPLVAAAEHDQPAIGLGQDLVAQPKPSHAPRCEVLDNHVGPVDQAPSQGQPGGRLQVERHRELVVVRHGEHAGTLGTGLVVDVRRVVAAEAVWMEAALDPDDLSPEVAKMLADHGAGGEAPQLNDVEALKSRAHAGCASTRPYSARTSAWCWPGDGAGPAIGSTSPSKRA